MSLGAAHQTGTSASSRPATRNRPVRPPGLFALYVTGYSAFRVFEESLRVDPSEHFLGLRLNMYVASAVALAGAAWFWRTQRRQRDGTSAAAVQATSARASGA